ncbi:MAG: ABC transporter ATP-binding protein [Sporolactobacillus sp.]
MMLIQVKDLVKRYQEFLAIDHLDLTIAEGEIFGLLGPNGAGKTTLINTMLGLTTCNQGDIQLFGTPLGKNEKAIKMKIGLVPQDLALYDDLSAEENVQLFGRLYKLKGKKLHQAVSEALAFTGLQEMRQKRPAQFSGGMKRRLNIACALVHHPELLIMDEPTVGIDPQSRHFILQSVKKLNAKGCTVIYISHYMEEVAALCTRIAIVDKGRIVASGTKEELSRLIEDDQVLTITVGEPNYTLIERLKDLPEVKDAVLTEHQIRLVGNGTALNPILQTLLDEGAAVLAVQSDQPTLEDVFLTLTGRALREENS